MEEETKKKTAAEVIIERFLADVDEKGTMPWQRPYERYNAFNYFSGATYRGINRLILPFGEYITRNQMNKYNKEKNEDYKFQKGIQWFPIVYFTEQKKDISKSEMEEKFDVDWSDDGYVGSDNIWNYYVFEGKGYKKRNVLKYYEVADRKWFKNSKGEMLPSRVESGEVVIVHEEPKKVIDAYIERSGVEVVYDSADTPCYLPMLDKIELNPYIKDEEAWYSTAFHEFAHSTGAENRLNRKGVNYPKGIDNKEKKDLYAVEECIAEITASLLCAECGIYTMETSESKEYENNLAYVHVWKKRVQDWGKSFIYIVSQADKAFNYILGDVEDNNR